MTVSSTNIDLFIRGESPGKCPGGNVSIPLYTICETMCLWYLKNVNKSNFEAWRCVPCIKFKVLRFAFEKTGFCIGSCFRI